MLKTERKTILILWMLIVIILLFPIEGVFFGSIEFQFVNKAGYGGIYFLIKYLEIDIYRKSIRNR